MQRVPNPEEGADSLTKKSLDLKWITSKETLKAQASLSLAKRAALIRNKIGVKLNTR